MFEYFQPNPLGLDVGDCTVRAMCRALDHDWDRAYMGLCAHGFELKNMPSANAVWGAFLRASGFHRRKLPDTCPDCYTVADFAAEHPNSLYVLGLDGHVVCVDHGNICDTFDSGGRTALYYWSKEDQ